MPDTPISGHVYRHEGARGPVWRAKYRLGDGRQVHRRVGPAWTGRGRAAAGFFTRRLAEEWLDSILVQPRAGTLPGAVRTGASFADACDEYLRFLEVDRQRKPSTLRDARATVRNHLLPAFGDWRLEDVSAEAVERWARELGRDRPLANRSKLKIIVIFHGLMERARRVWKLPLNPVRDVDRPRTAASAGGIDVFSPEEVLALVRAAEDEQDAALFLTAAFTGLRQGELVALRWRSVDFPGEHLRVTASYTNGALTSPKSGKVRAVPMAPAVAEALARLSQREHWTGDDALVFPGLTGSYLDASALLKRYKRALAAAGLRPLRFHDLRHTFGTTMIRKADIVRVQEWMGHADIETTRQYLHFVPRPDDA
ncbi:MAG: tyrosine-type recombinase/integrase, partial [Solirubrobacteraceae bacterium]